MPAEFPRSRALFLLALCAGFVVCASRSDAAPRSVHPALSHVEPGTALSERFLSHGRNGETFVELILEGDVPPGLLRARGIEVNTVAGHYMTARCPLGLLQALLGTPGLDRVQIAERCEPYLNQSIADAGVAGLRTVPPAGFSGQTGLGALVGIVDTGVDLGHSDFRLPDGRTRILSLWDQTATSGTPPVGYTYGAAWDSAAINDGITGETDPNGHGTHVFGISAGNGSATGNGLPAYTYVGVAPQADVVFVKTTFSTSAIIDGVAYLFGRAAAMGRPIVVNLSLGTQDGPHDGTYVFDQMINALTGPGRIVVASAGNAGEDNIHGRLDLNGVTPQTMVMTVPNYTKAAGTQNDYLLFTGWYPGGDHISLTIITPGGVSIGPIPWGASGAGNNTADGYVNVENGTSSPTNGDNEIYVEIFDAFANRPPGNGAWQFVFTPQSLTETGIVDMWIYSIHLGTAGAHASWTQGLAFGGVVGSPGNADSVVTVAAHTTKDCWGSVNGNSYCWNPHPTLGAIASFSSQGPRRDGAQKPDLSGPGFGVASSKSTLYPAPIELIVPDGVHYVEAGTSMSAPHVTGVVALLQAQSAWQSAGPSAIKQRLRSTARTDGFTGATPNAIWGYGKLDATVATAPVFVATVLHPKKGAQIAPGKVDSVQVVIGGGAADSVVIDLSTNGGANYSIPLGTLYGVTPGPPQSLSYFVDGFTMNTLTAKVRAVAYSASAGTATGYSDSLFKIQTPTAVEAEPLVGAPRFRLDRNRPNPFNPRTGIAFQIPTTGRVTLRVYSIRGTLVRTLVDQALPGGPYRVEWDGRDDRGAALASGVYVYELSQGTRRLSHKMSLLK